METQVCLEHAIHQHAQHDATTTMLYCSVLIKYAGAKSSCWSVLVPMVSQNKVHTSPNCLLANSKNNFI